MHAVLRECATGLGDAVIELVTRERDIVIVRCGSLRSSRVESAAENLDETSLYRTLCAADVPRKALRRCLSLSV